MQLRNVWYAALGALIGMFAARLALDHPRWTAEHPGLLALVGGTILSAAWLLVERHMRTAARASAHREEAFRLAMLAQFAPELLEREHGAA